MRMMTRNHQQTPLSDAVQKIVDHERAKSQAARRERTRTRVADVRDRLGPVARGLLWLQMLLPGTLLIGLALPESARTWLTRHEFVFELLLVYSLCAAPIVTLLAAGSRLPNRLKGRLVIATWVIAVGLGVAMLPAAM